MNHLTHVVLPDFCTNNILKVLAATCSDTLTHLSIDNCDKITDKAADYISMLHNLRLLSMLEATLSSESIAKILLALNNLVSIPKGDFLCDACLLYTSDAADE